MVNLKEIITTSPHPENVEKTLLSLGNKVVESLIKSEEIENFVFCCGVSHFIARESIRDPSIINDIFINKGYKNSINRNEQETKKIKDIKELKKWHKKEHIRIAVRDLLSIADVRRILKELSILADITIKKVVELHNGDYTNRIMIVGLGKLGGEELNYFSDIDLMYVYGNESNHEDFVRFFEKITSTLQDEKEGYKTYNVDLRLRPQGNAGPICLPIEAYRIYYENYGRFWEKMMLIKARPVLGNRNIIEEFYNIITPFVYKRYLDFSYIERIKNLRDEILQEASTLEDNIKLMRGGIREIEFIVNAFQLLYGGKIEWFRNPNITTTLSRLHASGFLNSEDYSKLYNGYIFLRKLENRLQISYRTQTHALPKNEKDLRRIAISMGFSGNHCIDQLKEKLEEIRNNISSIFEELFSDKREKTVTIINDPVIWDAVKNLNEEHENLGYILYEESINSVDAQLFMKNISFVIKNIEYPKHSFMDLILNDKNFRNLIVKILGTSQYVSKVLQKNKHLNEYIIQKIIDMSILDSKITNKKLKMISESLEDITPQTVRMIRDIVLTETMMLDSLKIIDINDVENILSKFAHIIVNKVYNKIKSKYNESNLNIIALGKFSTKEMLYFSDIDLMFLGDESDQNLNLANEFIKFFSKEKLLEDDIYTIDIRLKPFGSAGAIVTSPNSFIKYIEEHLRSWEILAYSRARSITGYNEEIKNIFEKLSSIKLHKNQFKDILEKVRDGFSKKIYDMKLSIGGIIEIDLILSYLKINFNLKSFSNKSLFKEVKAKNLIDRKILKQLEEDYYFLRLLEKNCKLLFYPPTSELPNKGKKLSILSKLIGKDEDYIIENFINTKKKICENINIIVEKL